MVRQGLSWWNAWLLEHLTRRTIARHCYEFDWRECARLWLSKWEDEVHDEAQAWHRWHSVRLPCDHWRWNAHDLFLQEGDDRLGLSRRKGCLEPENKSGWKQWWCWPRWERALKELWLWRARMVALVHVVLRWSCSSDNEALRKKALACYALSPCTIRLLHLDRHNCICR